MWIGKNGAGLDPPVYGEWIHTYADEVFIRLVALMEELTVNFSPAELDRLEQRLITASRYEFWKMG